MSWHNRITVVALAAAVAWGCWPSPARAELIEGSNGLNSLGAYTGTFSYTPNGGTQATLVISLTNTSPGGSGYLTAFVFNNPSKLITGATLDSSNANFALLGAAPFQDGVGGQPFGHFDLGASTGGSFTGGGNPSKGLGVGQTGTFTFALTGSDLDGLTANSFFSSLSAPPGQGKGPAAFVARFRGFDPEGSDKVPGVLVIRDDLPVVGVDQVPEPSALTVAAVGLGTLATWVACRRRVAGAAVRAGRG
jgi:hypothetical protein